MNRDVSTGPLAPPFTHSLAPLTHLRASDCSLCSRLPLRSLVRLLTLSLVGKCKIRCLKMAWFCPIVQWCEKKVAKSILFFKLIATGDCAWLNRRGSSFATLIIRTFPVKESGLPGMLIAYHHVGHKTMQGEEPFKVNKS